MEANLSGEEAGRGATGTLEDIRQAGRYIEEYVTDPNSKPEYYLIKYDRQGGTVRVESHREPISGVTSLDTLEVTNSEKGEKNVIEGILRMGCKAANQGVSQWCRVTKRLKNHGLCRSHRIALRL